MSVQRNTIPDIGGTTEYIKIKPCGWPTTEYIKIKSCGWSE